MQLQFTSRQVEELMRQRIQTVINDNLVSIDCARLSAVNGDPRNLLTVLLKLLIPVVTA